ncbi:Vibriobactin receptor [Vibrio mimicus]|nr:TonB-dependent receptor [Vibrio mimicus]MBY7676121.1 TonB-dependent receptor [Vibrio mimicus]MBY7727905.1 TonB-dependent receptor [Vibrio mimicus]SUQ23731.1 Vibriobactin receptor [Vibrio mimicus]
MHKKVPQISSLTLTMVLSTLTHPLLATENAREVIVIESSKQSIPLERIDSSVLVKTGEELERAGIYQVQDLGKVFPGLVIQSRGNRTYANTTIRGISSPDYYSPTVSVYVDGVLQDNAFLTQQLLNIERVELLRGPQGTLYGGNAQGGIINIVTKKSTGQPKAAADVSYSNLSKQFNGSSAFALTDSVYTDVVVRALKHDGNITHLPSNTKDANDTQEFSGVARIHYLPQNSPLTLSFSVSSDNLDSHEEWYLTQSEFDNKETRQPIPELQRIVNSYALQVGYDLGETQLTSVTAYQNRNIERQFIGGNWQEDQNTFSQEFRANTSFNETLSTLFGAYFEHRDFDAKSGATSKVTNQVKTDNYALFGQAIYAMTDAVDLTLGIRASHLSTRADYSGNPAWMINAYNQDKSENTLSPKAAIGWQLNEDTRIFTSLSSGYRPGGFSSQPRSNGDKNGYKDEKSLNGELGWRTRLVEDTLEFSGALYWIKTQDLQLYTGNPGSQVLRNMGDARSHGLELQFAFYPTHDLTLTLGGTLGESTFESGNQGLDGKTLPYAPNTTVVAGIEYFLPQSWVDGELSISSNARYTSSVFFDENNSLSQPSYTLVDLGVSYVVNPHLSLRLFGNNITDQEYKTYAFAMPGSSLMSNYGQGREIGLNVKLEW